VSSPAIPIAPSAIGKERMAANPISRTESSNPAPVQHVFSPARQHQSLMAADEIALII
jgi:hypothetical protein